MAGNWDTDQEIAVALRGGASSDERIARVQHVLVERITESVDRHSLALTKAAEASDRYASRLVMATWALVVATIVLVVATLRLAN
jgi:hypothetical protein